MELCKVTGAKPAPDNVSFQKVECRRDGDQSTFSGCDKFGGLDGSEIRRFSGRVKDPPVFLECQPERENNSMALGYVERGDG